MTADQLRECPFCGSSNVVVRGMDKVYSDRGWVRYKRGGWFVMCDGCKFSHGSRFVFDAEGSIPCHAHNSADEAIAAWNTRPTAVASHAEGEAFGRGYVKGYQAGLGAAAEECRRMGHALDSGGNEYVRYGDAIKCAAAIGGLRAPELNEPSGNSGELEKMNEPFGNSEEFTHPPRSGDEARDAAYWKDRAHAAEDKIAIQPLMDVCRQCDECAPYLKEDETPAHRIERERKDVEACLRLLQIERTLTDIDRLVDRFLAWPLPSTVCPDGCVMNRDYPYRIGTHLLTAEEAKAMFIHALGRDAAMAARNDEK